MPLRPLLLFALLAATALAAEPAAPSTAAANSAYVDDQGRTHVTRVVPAPQTVSPEAREKLLHPPASILASGASVSEQRARMDARQANDAADWLKAYPVVVTDSNLAGVPVRLFTPVGPVDESRVLVNLHGGGFRVDSGSLLESIPLANLTRTRVVSVLYRMAPEHPFPAAVDDVVAIYRELLKDHAPAKIALFGSSAGAVLTAETAVRLKQLGLPLPGALGIFSCFGDFTKPGDSMSLFSLQGLTGAVMTHGPEPMLPEYVGQTSLTDPVLSPAYADLHGLPPTLFVTSTRDSLLSGTVMLHQSFLQAGVDARLLVYEAQPHTFWLDAHLPEARTAVADMARFFDQHLAR